MVLCEAGDFCVGGWKNCVMNRFIVEWNNVLLNYEIVLNDLIDFFLFTY